MPEAVEVYRATSGAPSSEKRCRVETLGCAINPKAFQKLLNITTGVLQVECGDQAGRYPGIPTTLSLDQIARHLDGSASYAFAAIGLRGGCQIGAIDIDCDFARLLPKVRLGLNIVGRDELSRACFVTGGSAPNRGKVVMTLEAPTRDGVAQVRALLTEVMRIARTRFEFGQLSSSDLKIVPQYGAGGLVRILGRNRDPRRAGSMENAYTLDGRPTDLTNIKPLSLSSLSLMTRDLVGAKQPARWCARMITTSWTRDEVGGTNDAFRRLVAIAREVIRLHGVGSEGEAVYRDFTERIRANSPDFGRPSEKTRDQRNPLLWNRAGRRAWACAIRVPRSFRAKNAREFVRNEGAVRAYDAVCEHVISNGLPSALFALDYGRIAEFCAMSNKLDAHRAMKHLVRAGLVDLVDKGAKHERGKRGLITFWALVGQDQTLEGVREERSRSPRVYGRLRRRLEARQDRTLGSCDRVCVI